MATSENQKPSSPWQALRHNYSQHRYNTPNVRVSTPEHQLPTQAKACHFYTYKGSTDSSYINEYGSINNHKASKTSNNQPQLSQLSSYQELSAPVKQQDNYLKNFNVNRRVEKEKQKKCEFKSERNLSSSYSMQHLFKKKPQIYERSQNTLGKKSSVMSTRNSKDGKTKKEKGELDEWQTRLKLLKELQTIGHMSKAYQQEEDYQEMCESPNQLFQKHVSNKIKSDNSEMPLSLIPIQANRKFLMDKLIHYKGQFFETPTSQKEFEIKALEQRNLIRSNPTRFLTGLKKSTEEKFKDQVISEEIKDQRVKKMLDMKSRSQYHNVQTQFRFLPVKKQKKMMRDLGVVVSEKFRYRAINQYLSNQIKGEAVEDYQD